MQKEYNENIRTYLFLQKIIKNVEDWQGNMSSGCVKDKEIYEEYDKSTWLKIAAKIKEIENKEIKSQVDKEFLSIKYVGPVFRIMNVKSNNKVGKIYPLENYQSWSKRIDCLCHVSTTKFYAPIVVEGYITPDYYAIDINKLLSFYYKYFKGWLSWDGIYKKEKEVVVPIYKEIVHSMFKAEFVGKDLLRIEEIPKEKWFRKRWFYNKTHSESDDVIESINVDENIRVGIYNIKTEKVALFGTEVSCDFCDIDSKIVNDFGNTAVSIKSEASSYLETKDGKLYNFRCEEPHYIPIIFKNDKQYALIGFDWMELINGNYTKLSKEERDNLIEITELYNVKCKKDGCIEKRGSLKCKSCFKMKAEVICWGLKNTYFRGWYGNATDGNYYSEIEYKYLNPINNK